VQALEELSLRIKLLEREISDQARSKYPDTAWLEQIPGVGPITALYFVLKIEDPARFKSARDVGAFLGLCPRRDQSGENDPQLRSSKRRSERSQDVLSRAAANPRSDLSPPKCDRSQIVVEALKAGLLDEL
jgi:transposase